MMLSVETHSVRDVHRDVLLVLHCQQLDLVDEFLGKLLLLRHHSEQMSTGPCSPGTQRRGNLQA